MEKEGKTTNEKNGGENECMNTERERKVREEGGKPKLFCKDVIHVSLVLRAYPN